LATEIVRPVWVDKPQAFPYNAAHGKMPAETVEPTPLIFWIAFLVCVLTVLALDLFVFHKKAQAVTLKEAGTC
jgi:hypothetical protein